MSDGFITVLRGDEPLIRALAAAGWSATFADNDELTERGERGSYFYLGNAFEQIKTPLRFAQIRRRLAADRAPYVWWNRDAPWNCAIKPWRKLLVRAARRADIHLAHSLQSVDLFGAPAVYFPNAAQVERYNLAGRTLESLRGPANYRYDVTFVGTLNPGYRRLRSRIEFLGELTGRLGRRGVACRLFDTSVGSTLAVSEQVDIIQASRINLNVGAVCDHPVVSWGLPERCFGIAACGGFLLCDERKHAAETFPADAWEAFSSLEECVARIEFFLGHFELARDKAERLHRDVMEHHTYGIRARQLLSLVAAWRAAR